MGRLELLERRIVACAEPIEEFRLLNTIVRVVIHCKHQKSKRRAGRNRLQRLDSFECVVQLRTLPRWRRGLESLQPDESLDGFTMIAVDSASGFKRCPRQRGTILSEKGFGEHVAVRCVPVFDTHLPIYSESPVQRHVMTPQGLRGSIAAFRAAGLNRRGGAGLTDA